MTAGRRFEVIIVGGGIAGAAARIASHVFSLKRTMTPERTRSGVSAKPAGGWRRKWPPMTLRAWRVVIGSSSASVAALRPVAW